MRINIDYLIEQAFGARENSYSPYSEFMVGAALLADNGKVYHGCNIESVSYSPTNCAERTAFFNAISDGRRKFEAIAIVGFKKNSHEYTWTYPCGVCRQVMLEFCDPKHFKVIVAKTRKEYKIFNLEELIPNGFAPEVLI